MQPPSGDPDGYDSCLFESLPVEILAHILCQCPLVAATRASRASHTMAVAYRAMLVGRRARAARIWSAHGESRASKSLMLTEAVITDNTRTIEDMWLVGNLPREVYVFYRYSRETRPRAPGRDRRHVNRIVTVTPCDGDDGRGKDLDRPFTDATMDLVRIELAHVALWAGAVSTFALIASWRRAPDPIDCLNSLWFVRFGIDAASLDEARPYPAGALYAAVAAACDSKATRASFPFGQHQRSLGSVGSARLVEYPLATLVEAAQDVAFALMHYSPSTRAVFLKRRPVDCDDKTRYQTRTIARFAKSLGVTRWQLKRLTERIGGRRITDKRQTRRILAAVALAAESVGLVTGLAAIVSIGFGVGDVSLDRECGGVAGLAKEHTLRRVCFDHCLTGKDVPPTDRRVAEAVLAHVALAFVDAIAPPTNRHALIFARLVSGLSMVISRLFQRQEAQST